MMVGVNMMEMMPQMMMDMMGGVEGKGGMPARMSKMMEGDDDSGQGLTLPEMVPHRLEIMLPKEKRIDLVLNLVETGAKHGCAGSRHVSCAA